MRVLLAEDDVATAQGITLALKAARMIVDHADLGEEALEMVKHYDYDVVLVALRLPDMSGLDVVRRMRGAKHGAPVLMLSQDSSAQTKVKAFGVGVDDFVMKPVDHEELAARLQAIARRSRGYSDPTMRVGKLQINLQSSEVFVGETRVRLTGKEFAILELLVMRKGITLTKDAFLNHLYGGMDEPEAKIIDVFICKLRKKLQLAGADNIIGTVWGRGYVLREEAALPENTIVIDIPLTTKNPLHVM